MKKESIRYLIRINDLELAYKHTKDLETFKNEFDKMYDGKLKSMRNYGKYSYKKASNLRYQLMCVYYLSSYDELRSIYRQYINDMDNRMREQSNGNEIKFLTYKDDSMFYEDVNNRFPELIQQIRNHIKVDTNSGDYKYTYNWSLSEKEIYLYDYILKLSNDIDPLKQDNDINEIEMF